MGVVTFRDDGGDAPQLLQRAELALFRAKETGAEIGMFVKGDDEVRRQRMSILGDLRHAIASGQLELYYQPKITLLGGRGRGLRGAGGLAAP